MSPAFHMLRLLVLVALAIPVFSEEYCAATSTINTELNGLYNYPIDIFYPEKLNSLQNSSRIIACNSEASPKLHKCAKDYKSCPITKEIIELATRRGRRWAPPGYLCQLRDIISDYDEESNIIIFGGSVTVGHEASGCHCSPDVQPNCQFKGFRPNQEDKEHDFWFIMEYCRWALHFVRGYRSLAMSKVNIYNFGQGGIESAYSADMVLNRFEKFKLKPTSRDIILIDHSTNDAYFTHDDQSAHTMQEGVENLIRNIYHFSDHTSPPVIIYLAQFPKALGTANVPLDYQQLYSTVTEHYRVPLWSLRDAMTVLNGRANTPQASAAEKLYVPYVRNERNNVGGIHPPWFVHMYMADLYLAILKSEMARCFADPTLIGLKTTVVNTAAAAANLANEDSIDNLLPDRVINSTMHYCGFKSAYALEIFSSDVQNKHAVTGKYVPTPGFPLVTERNGKVGWVSELATPADVHSLNFEFIASTVLQSGHTTWLLDVKFLKSYENGGIAQIMLCGNPVKGGLLDGMWSDPAKFHFSETSTYSAEIVVAEYCAAGVNKDAQGTTAGMYRLQIQHKMVHCDASDPVKPAAFCAERKATQKVKVTAITMCAV